MEQVFHTSICQYVYAKIQDFVQSDLREPLRASIKKKKEKMRTIISSIRATCADWENGHPPPNDPCLKGEKVRVQKLSIFNRRAANVCSREH